MAYLLDLDWINVAKGVNEYGRCLIVFVLAQSYEMSAASFNIIL